MTNKKKPMTPREARDQGRQGGSGRQNHVSREQKMLEAGGWRPLVINPNREESVRFLHPNAMGYFTFQEAVASEERRAKAVGEMLSKEFGGGGIKCGDDGIPWIWGMPPAPKKLSKRQQGRNSSYCEEGLDPKTGKHVRFNREFRRRDKNRG